MRTFAAYFSGLLFALLWIMAGYGFSPAVSPDQTPRTEKTESVRTQDGLTFNDLQDNIRFFEHPERARISVPERSETPVRPYAPAGGTGLCTPDTGTDVHVRYHCKRLSRPSVRSGHAVDYHVFALRKILI